MSNLFAEDGSVIPNIRTIEYTVTLLSTKIHHKVRYAEIIFNAEPGTEWRYAQYLAKQLPNMTVQSVHEFRPTNGIEL